MRPLTAVLFSVLCACNARSLDAFDAPLSTRQLVPGFDLGAGERRQFPVRLPGDTEFFQVQHTTAVGSVMVTLDDPTCLGGPVPYCMFQSDPEPLTITVESPAGAAGVVLLPFAVAPHQQEVVLQRDYLREDTCVAVELPDTPGALDVFFTVAPTGLDDRWTCGSSQISRHCQLQYAVPETVDICLTGNQIAGIELTAATEFAGGITDAPTFDMEFDDATPETIAVTASVAMEVETLGSVARVPESESAPLTSHVFTTLGSDGAMLTAGEPLGWVRVWSFDDIPRPTPEGDGPPTSPGMAATLIPGQTASGHVEAGTSHYFSLPTGAVTLLLEGSAMHGDSLSSDFRDLDPTTHGIAPDFVAMSIEAPPNSVFVVQSEGDYRITTVLEPSEIPDLRMVEINRDFQIDVGCDDGPSPRTSRFVEVINQGQNAVSLLGFRIGDRVVADGTPIQPSERFVIAEDGPGCALTEATTLDVGGTWSPEFLGEVVLATPSGQTLDTASLPTSTEYGSFVRTADDQWVPHPGGFFDMRVSPGAPH